MLQVIEAFQNIQGDRSVLHILADQVADVPWICRTAALLGLQAARGFPPIATPRQRVYKPSGFQTAKRSIVRRRSLRAVTSSIHSMTPVALRSARGNAFDQERVAC